MVMNSKGLPADGTAATRLQDSSPSRSMECCPSPVSPPPSTTNYNVVRYRCSNHSSSDSIEGNFYIYNRFITAHIPNDLLQSSQPSLIWQTAGTDHASILIELRANLNRHIKCLWVCIPFASRNESFHIFPNSVQTFCECSGLNIGTPVYGDIALFNDQSGCLLRKCAWLLYNCSFWFTQYSFSKYQSEGTCWRMEPSLEPSLSNLQSSTVSWSHVHA